MAQGLASRLARQKSIDSLIPWQMHEGQQRAWDSTRRFVAVIAGSMGGKTSWGPWWLAREIERTYCKTARFNDYLAISASYDLFQLKMLPEMLKCFCEDIKGWTWQSGIGVLSKDGTNIRVIIRSAQAKGGLESAEARAAWLDECGQDEFQVTAWQAIQRRLALNQGRALLTTTPYNLGWLKFEIFDRWKGGNPDYDVIQFASTMNPAFPAEEYERARSVLPSWKFEMFYNGNFTRPAGLIYGDYDESIHLVKPFTIPGTWLRTVGVDFGASVHNALIWIAERPNTLEEHERTDLPGLPGDYYAYRETCGIDDTGPEQARTALEYGEPVREWLGGTASEDAARQDWQLAGCPVSKPYIHDVEVGIDRVIGLFRARRLYVFDTLTGLRSELGTYSRKLDDAGEPLQAINDKEKFHRMDALRYACSALRLDRPGRPELPPGLWSVAHMDELEQASRATW